MSWSRRFDKPIERLRGRQLVTLQDAATYIMKLQKAEQNLPEWQAAIEALLLVAEHDGPTMLARIGVMQALNRQVVREFNLTTSPIIGENTSWRGTNESPSRAQ